MRKPLLNAAIDGRRVAAVDVREISFEPGQKTGRHLHPCPVLGYVAEGAAILQIEGQPDQELRAGSAFYEPADTVIARFDNASSSERMRFIAYYLLEGNEALIEMLPELGAV